MAIFNDSELDVNLPDLNFSDEPGYLPSAQKNQRRAIRYVRTDITAYVSYKDLLRSAKTIAVKLLDITSKGASIQTTEKFALNKPICLILNFKDGKQFDINAKIIRHTPASNYEYGIKFDACHNLLGDYLSATQDRFIFK